MKKPKVKLTKKFLEKHWNEFRPASKEHVQKVLARNEKMRAARATKGGVINMRANKDDLEKLRAIAEKKGLGYQTLLASIIHQYVNEELVEISEARKILKVS